MKVLSRLLSILILAVAVMQLGSCKKIIDKLHKDPVATLDACAISRIIVHSDGRTYDFTYDAEGKPVSVINDQVGTGYPNYFFYYDSEDRLIEAIGLYTNGAYESWHKFGYDHHDRIVKDTQYVFGLYGPEPDPNSYSISEHTFTYDVSRRIIRDDIVFFQPMGNPPVVNTYSYTASGNLTGGAYDNRISLHRTNKVWMFMDKDYSRNNRIAATSYNAYNLPLGFNQPSPFNFLGMPINDNTTIEYVCDAAP